MWLVLLAFGCPDGLVCGELGTPSIELGQGELAFRPLEPLDVLSMESGPQGGTHAWGAARFRGIHPGRPNLLADDGAPSVLAEVQTGDSIRAFRTFDEALQGDESPYDVFGLQLIFDVGTSTQAVYRVGVTDVCGTAIEAEIDVTLPVKDGSFR